MLETLESSLCGNAIHELLHPQAYLTDSPIDYYRILLVKDEMKRALMYRQKDWRRSWIHSTSFMQLLLTKDENESKWIFNYEFVKNVERKYIGKLAKHSTVFVSQLDS